MAHNLNHPTMRLVAKRHTVIIMLAFAFLFGLLHNSPQPVKAVKANTETVKTVQKLLTISAADQTIAPIQTTLNPVIAGLPVLSPAVTGEKSVADPADTKPQASKPVIPKPAVNANGVPFLTSLASQAGCKQGTTLNVVAHEDDDLLFINPAIAADLAAGRCIRTVYLTGGDAGQTADYWRGRELGVQMAYAGMTGQENVWKNHNFSIAGQEITVATLQNNPSVSLVFLRLPDGNMHGEGFAVSNNETLQSLLAGTVPLVHTLDTQVPYSKEEIVGMLIRLMYLDRPDIIRTLGGADPADGDHSDHHAVGSYVQLASDEYDVTHTLLHYVGYPIRGLPVNMTDADTFSKQQTFLLYAQFDGAVCQSMVECQQASLYGDFLSRSYTSESAAQAQSTSQPTH